MTALRQTGVSGADLRGWRFRGGEYLTARISLAGRVIVHQIIAVPQSDGAGALHLFPRTSIQHDLGPVDPDDQDCWAHAERMLFAAGYVLADDWTTIDRLPAVRLRRHDKTSPRTVRGVK